MVRQQVLILRIEGSNPSSPTSVMPDQKVGIFALEPLAWRCCMDIFGPKHPLPQTISRMHSRSPDGVWPSSVKHTVEYGYANSRFGILAIWASRP